VRSGIFAGQVRVWGKTDQFYVLEFDKLNLKPANALIDLRNAADPASRERLVQDLAHTLFTFFHPNKGAFGRESEKNYSLNQLIFLMPDGTIQMLDRKKGRRWSKDEALQAVKAMLDRAQKQGVQPVQFVRSRNFYTATDGKRYEDRTENVPAPGQDLSDLLTAQPGLWAAFRHDLICVGFSVQEAPKMSGAFNYLGIKGLFWKGSEARSVTPVPFEPPARTEASEDSGPGTESGTATLGLSNRVLSWMGVKPNAEVIGLLYIVGDGVVEPVARTLHRCRGDDAAK
jgi:hypothetical protein